MVIIYLHPDPYLLVQSPQPYYSWGMSCQGKCTCDDGTRAKAEIRFAQLWHLSWIVTYVDGIWLHMLPSDRLFPLLYVPHVASKIG